MLRGLWDQTVTQQKNSTDRPGLRTSVLFFLQAIYFFQWQVCVLLISADKPYSDLGGRENCYLFNNSSDKVIVKFSKVQVFLIVDIK